MQSAVMDLFLYFVTVNHCLQLKIVILVSTICTLFMYASINKPTNSSESDDRQHASKEGMGSSVFQFKDQREESIRFSKTKDAVSESSKAQTIRPIQEMAVQFAERQKMPVQKKENNTGLPDNLKSGVENLSGYSLDDVKVHYNSDQPAQLQAHAYAQGTDIHVAPGQEKHLPHEAWHVVQQKQGRVNPTLQLKGVAINDNDSLEKEADLMGAKAMQLKVDESPKELQQVSSNTPVQRQEDESAVLESGIRELEGIAKQAEGNSNIDPAVLLEIQQKIEALKKVAGGNDSQAKSAEGNALMRELGKEISASEGESPVQKKSNGAVVQRLTGREIAAIAGVSTLAAIGIGFLIRHLLRDDTPPEIRAMRNYVNTLPVINKPGDMAALQGANAALIIAAQGQMQNNADTAEHTIAMFQYMSRHAAGLDARITQDFLTLPDNAKDHYLQELSTSMHAKIERGLWIGGEDRGDIILGVTTAANYFDLGRTNLINQSAAALAGNHSLVDMLEDLSNNLDAKSYGRRQESMGLLNVGNLPVVGGGAAPPVANVPVPHNQAGYVYYAMDYITVVAANALVAGTDYVLRINGAPGIDVTVGVQGVNDVTFSSVG